MNTTLPELPPNLANDVRVAQQLAKSISERAVFGLHGQGLKLLILDRALSCATPSNPELVQQAALFLQGHPVEPPEISPLDLNRVLSITSGANLPLGVTTVAELLVDTKVNSAMLVAATLCGHKAMQLAKAANYTPDDIALWGRTGYESFFIGVLTWQEQQRKTQATPGIDDFPACKAAAIGLVTNIPTDRYPDFALFILEQAKAVSPPKNPKRFEETVRFLQGKGPKPNLENSPPNPADVQRHLDLAVDAIAELTLHSLLPQALSLFTIISTTKALRAARELGLEPNQAAQASLDAHHLAWSQLQTQANSYLN